MSSLQTFFRTVVMLATLGIVAKLWFFYGPSVGELKSIGTRVAELSAQAWNDYWKPAGGTQSLASDSRGPIAPAPFVPSPGPMQPIPLPPINATAPGPVQLANGFGTQSAPEAPPLSPAAPTNFIPPKGATLVPMDSPRGEDQLVTDVRKLADLGVHKQQVTPWGNGGTLYRCNCDAPWPAAPNYSRHFEAVAPTAEAAVEQVTAEVVAWRNSQPATVTK
jgi:hypothetical protein